jgi:hypothetical protein
MPPTLPPTARSTSLGIIEFLENDQRVAVREVDLKTMDAFRPGWPGDPLGSPINVMRPEAGDKLVFYVYPPATAGVAMRVRHVAVTSYLIDDDVDGRLVPFLPAVAAFISAKAESREVEEVGPQRKGSFEADFLAAAGANPK